MRLPDLLVSEGVVHPDIVVEVFEAQALYGGSFDTNLLELGFIDEKRLLPYLERAYGIANRVDVLAEPALEALQRLPRERAEALRLCPFRLSGRTLDVVLCDPTDVRALDEVGMISGTRVHPNVAIEARVALHLYRGYGTPMPNRLVSVLKGRTWPKPLVSRRPRPAAKSEPPAGKALVDIDLSVPPLMPAAPSPSPSASPLAVQAPDESATDQVLRFDVTELKPPVSTPPLSEVDLEARLTRATERDAIPPLILGYLAELSRVVLFRVRKTDIAGWDAGGERVAREAALGLSFPLDAASVFSQIAADVAPFEGPLPHGPIEEAFVARLGGRWPEHALLVPVRVKGRVVALLYAELSPGAPANAREMVLRAARHIAETLVRLILSRKAGS